MVTQADVNDKLNKLEERLKRDFNNKLDKLRKEYNDRIIALDARVDEQRVMLRDKDTELGKLNQEVGKLQQCCDHLTGETTELKRDIDINKTGITKEKKHIEFLEEKNSDLEDRSRRHNVVFYNFEEQEKGTEENCSKLLANMLDKQGFGFNADKHDFMFDRAHRIGKFKGAGKPRPIVAKFTFFRDKDFVMKNGKLLKDCPIGMNHDYSMKTRAVHKQLLDYAKGAKTDVNMIKSYRLAYRRIFLYYENENKTTFFKSFTLEDIENKGPQWFQP